MIDVRLTLLSLLVAATALSPHADAQVQFRNIGPGGGGTAGCMAMNPANPNEVYVGLDCGGMHRTADGGSIWSNVNGTGEWYYAINGAYNVDWNNHYGALVLDTGRVVVTSYAGQIYYSDDHGINWIKAYDCYGSPGTLLQHPTEAAIIYTMTGRGIWERGRILHTSNVPDGPWTGSIYVSSNRGTTWDKLNTGSSNIPVCAYIYSMAIDYANPSLMYAATDYGMYKSTDGGVNWTSIQAGLGTDVGKMLLTLPNNPNTVFVTMGELPNGAYGNIRKSTDAGTTWTSASTGLPSTTNFSTIARDPINSNILYAGSTDWVGGIYRSTDGGNNWSALFTQESLSTASSTFIENNRMWHSMSPHVSVGCAIACGGGDADGDGRSDVIYFLGDNVGIIWKSTDEGANWQQVVSNRKEIDNKAYYSSKGEIDFLCTRQIVVDPNDSKHLWMSCFDWGLLESIDGGHSFSSAFGPYLSNQLIAATHGVVLDKDDPNIVYCTGGNAVITNSGGNGWWIMGGGANAVNGLPAIAEEIYITKWTSGSYTYKYLYAIGGGKVYRKNLYNSTNWVDVSTGISTSETGLAKITGVNNSSTLYMTGALGIYKSTYGTSWTRLTGDGKTCTVLKTYMPDIVVDPNNSQRIFVTRMGPYQVIDEEGVYMSENAGSSWSRIDKIPIPYGLAVDTSGTSTKIYATTAIQGIYLLEYNNGSWATSIFANKTNGLANTRGWGVTVDPHDPSRIYVGSHGTAAFVCGPDQNLVMRDTFDALDLRAWNVVGSVSVSGGFLQAGNNNYIYSQRTASTQDGKIEAVFSNVGTDSWLTYYQEMGLITADYGQYIMLCQDNYPDHTVLRIKGPNGEASYVLEAGFWGISGPELRDADCGQTWKIVLTNSTLKLYVNNVLYASLTEGQNLSSTPGWPHSGTVSLPTAGLRMHVRGMSSGSFKVGGVDFSTTQSTTP